MKMIFGLIAAMAVSTSAMAEPLWRDIEAGMTVDEVHALYPEGKYDGRHVEYHDKLTELHGVFELVDDCKVRVEIEHPDGVVTGMRIWQRSKGIFAKMCPIEARSAALRKFGEPVTQDRKEVALFGWPTEEEELVWVTDDLAVTYRRWGANEEWSLEYEVLPAGSGL